jgi:hypothetical protein
MAPEDVSNKAFAAEDSGLLCLSWPVARMRVRENEKCSLSDLEYGKKPEKR